MNTQVADDTLVIERTMPHPAEKIWRALTTPELIQEWLMQSDFKPIVGHKFNFRADPMPHWNGVTDCEVKIVEPHRRLAYTWNASGKEAVNGLKTLVTWTLTPTDGGTRVRMEQSGFRPEDRRNYQGANYGWQKYLGALERVVADLGG
jgi:uncharacterized protein YndB with AHSA1/START domain